MLKPYATKKVLLTQAPL